MNMMNKNSLINGQTLEFWEACYRPGMPEFSAVSWAYTVESEDTVRVAFGNLGPYNLEGSRTPVFTNAVTIPADVAVGLAHALLQHFAASESDRPGARKQA
jgi:hypothetical protein